MKVNKFFLIAIISLVYISGNIYAIDRPAAEQANYVVSKCDNDHKGLEKQSKISTIKQKSGFFHRAKERLFSRTRHSEAGIFAIIGFIFSIIALFAFPIIFGVLGIVFSALGLRSGRTRRILAIAGLIIGIVAIVLFLL